MARGKTSPNPMVGSVIVYKDTIIGEGYHHRAGEPHAEVMAWRSVPEQLRDRIGEATWYVSLEPCSHHGKTPPCADLLASLHPRRVVIAMADPFAQVDGRGIARLRDAGIEVSVGILEPEAKRLNRHFIVAQTAHRPYVTLKWAESHDHYIDHLRSEEGPLPYHFSSPIRQRYVHHLRGLHDAILVGHHTAQIDDPQLTNRLPRGHQPIRVVWCHSQLPNPNLRMLHAVHGESIIALPKNLYSQAKMTDYPSSVSWLPLDGEDVSTLLSALYHRGIHSLLVEGGSRTLQAFIDAQLYDELDIEHAPVSLGKGVTAPIVTATEATE